MSRTTGGTDFIAVLRRAANPPVKELRFWTVQAMVVVIAGIHLASDVYISPSNTSFPVGLPVALLIIPVLYAALRYGLTGSAATGIWATLLWLPDLLLPNDHGHVGSDLVNLALVDLVAIFVGHRVEAERLSAARIASITAKRLSAEALYHQLFETNSSPILVVGADGVVSDSNPAARAMFGDNIRGETVPNLLGGSWPPQAGRLLTLANGHDYRLAVATLGEEESRPLSQLVLEDVTEELTGERRATRYARMVVEAEEEQRLRLSRELHDEPLQVFLHLARRLESLSEEPDTPSEITKGLTEVRNLALEAAGVVRSLAHDLRPPSLDLLGMVPALTGTIREIEEENGLAGSFEVVGTETRLPPEIELAAFRIVQEAVRNTVRHASARHLAVRVEFKPFDLVLEITDDGEGFAPGSGEDPNSRHLGLLGMSERARMLGGSVKVESTTGKGTKIIALLPLSQAEDSGKPAVL